ncbi:hypothetical protein [Halorubrum sp. CSM-61]|uniref:DUF7312 domain-containing protein n=1 Tax=Halorubrum sp. CSM-61 TaxID=2485838 RepID=UPI000F4D1E2B|nr:hypothetical protein [Halorubrum sp. CSM-61]
MSSDDDRDDVRSRANETRPDEAEGGDNDDESEWRFAVDDVGPGGVTEDTHTPESEPIEPGSIDAEHAVFVALGVVLTIGVLFVGF